ncbi:MAG: FAD-dependent oxidoreductase, partial [Victivallales bacterium]|nr:FAD-dependent oxidoreductase [Victivallales bacterium]
MRGAFDHGANFKTIAMRKDYDVIIIGAGSGGIGAAVGAARTGANVLIVDRAPSIGGVVAYS